MNGAKAPVPSTRMAACSPARGTTHKEVAPHARPHDRPIIPPPQGHTNMDHGTISQAIARLHTETKALTQATRAIAPFITARSYDPLHAWFDVPFLLLPQGDTRLMILKGMWHTKTPEWSNGPDHSAHQNMAVAEAKHRWATHHGPMLSAIRASVEALLQAAYSPQALHDTVRPIDANVSVRVDAQGASVSINVLRTPTSPQRPVKEETRRLSLEHDASWLPLLLRGILHTARQEPPGAQVPRWQIAATLEHATTLNKGLNVQQKVQAATAQEALMAVALHSHNSLVVPHRVSALEIHQTFDVDDHQSFLAALDAAFP